MRSTIGIDSSHVSLVMILLVLAFLVHVNEGSYYEDYSLVAEGVSFSQGIRLQVDPIQCTQRIVSHNQTSNMECIRRACNQEKPKAIVCNQSLILISDVTNWRIKRNHAALGVVKSICMGRESCDPSTVCSKSTLSTLYIHYVCEDAKNVFTSTCNDTVFEISAQHGFIQSPSYPATLPGPKSCRWRITPPNGSHVLLKLHDITTSDPTGKCNGGLTVSGLDCEDPSSGISNVRLCGEGDHNVSVVRCGVINIQLFQSKKAYVLRFWLEFRVLQSNQPAHIASTGLTCSGRAPSTNTVTKENSTMVAKETDTQLLIILLSVISSLSGALIIVLVIVCIRCRLMRMTVSDHVYCEPSPALQAHYDYISSLDTEKPSPELADEYFEVADALPYNLRATPASPAYAEVEQFIDFKRGPQSSADSTEWADCQSQYSNTDRAADHDETGTPGSPGKWRTNKPFMEGRSKNSANKHKHNIVAGSGSPKHRNNSGRVSSSNSASEPKVFIVNLKKNVPDTTCLRDDNSGYEQIEILSGLEGGRVVLSNAKTRPEVDVSNLRKSSDRIKPVSQGTRQNSSSHKSRVDQIKEGLLSKHNDKKEGVYSKAKEPGLPSIPNTSNDRNSRPSTPEKKHKSCGGGVTKKSTKSQDVDNETKKSQKPLLLKERLQTSGIVRNGIQKFENNSE